MRYSKVASIVFGISCIIFGLGILLKTTDVPQKYTTSSSDDSIISVPYPLVSEEQMLESIASYSATSILVVDASSLTPLIHKNADQKVAPASLTKLVTAQVAVDTYNPNDLLEITDRFRSSYDLGMSAYSKYSAQDLIKASLIQSANEAAFSLATNHSEGYDAFIEMMNKKVVDLGLEDSHFTNPAGYDAAAHYSTAHDLAIIAADVVDNQTLSDIVATESDTIYDQTLDYAITITNTNALLSDESIKGMKTGTTDWAQQNLIVLAEKDDSQIIIVLLGSDDRYTEARSLIEYVFSHYKWQQFSV